MLERVLMAGSGGQGVISIGKLLAEVAMGRVEHVTFLPAYGAEVRGGTSHCELVLSSREIASPSPERFDAMLIMNQESLARYGDRGGEGAVVIVNRSLCTGTAPAGAMEVRATEDAVSMGGMRAANFVMLGAYLGRRAVVPRETVVAEMQRRFMGKGAAVANLNLAALDRGYEYARR